MAKYLYGASVQGIQDFIFMTNKLREIVGASEIVKEICDDMFFEVSGIDRDSDNLILAAAGNIKCIFEENQREKLEIVVKYFPKMVMEYAPGITISQAVIKFERETSQALKELEIALKVQRNISSMPLETGYMALNRARKTGGIYFKNGDEESTVKKSDKSDQIGMFKDLSGFNEIKSGELSFEMNHITDTGNNKWLAVVHADGNGLGNIIQNIGNRLTDENKFHKFSQAIDSSTKAALQIAFKEVILKDKGEYEKGKKSESYRYPIRPVLIGGDDVTLIIRADLALDFTTLFLKKFEEISKIKFAEFNFSELNYGLSACAGIAYIKESYPLHYALHLAEDLTKDAKKMVKKEGMPKSGGNRSQMPLSSIAFHKVQDSFVENLEQMKKRTKFAEASKIDYDYGPYLIQKSESNPNIPYIGELNEKLKVLDCHKTDKSKGVSKLRQLVTESFNSRDKMDFMKNRMKTVNEKFLNKLSESDIIREGNKSILLDLIQIHSFK